MDKELSAWINSELTDLSLRDNLFVTIHKVCRAQILVFMLLLMLVFFVGDKIEFESSDSKSY